ncbi:MAG: hypothetical protein B7X47_10190 [Ferrovum sp. 34-44-207]|nr:MAG: hypothetical protein B7X47_10190 [Ferrovum sp. 34-44-207]
MINWLNRLINGPQDKLDRVIPIAKDTGKRLLPRTKWIIVTIISILITLVVFGIVSAGHTHSITSDDINLTNPSLIGTAPPPQPPPVVSDFTSLSDHTLNSHSADTAIQQPNSSMAEKATEHQSWLNHHNDQRLENHITSFEKALTAPITTTVTDHPSITALPVNPTYGTPRNASPNKPLSEEEQFLQHSSQVGDGTFSSSPLGKHELSAGSILNATLITAINSDLPGLITAQISENIFDSLHPNDLLIPQGTKLIGRYDNHLAFGQRRVFIVWNSLLFPDGSTFNLKGLEGSDEQGQSGLTDLTDNHTGRIISSALLISVLGVGAQLSQPQNSSLLTSPNTGQLAAGSAANELNMVGSQLLQKNLSIAPTLEIRAGTELTILVNQTLILPPYNHD